MITIIYPYRNREPDRIKRSLDSLVQQTNLEFNVVFVDYGSKKEIAESIKRVVQTYSFVTYHYLFTEHQPWNKSKALNYVIKNLDTTYCFVADVDMIFHPDFVHLLNQECHSSTVTYFEVGFLSEEESLKALPFDDYKVKFNSSKEATGMSLFPVKKLLEVQGFDEFFHFWGAEDTDLHNRLKNTDCTINYYNENTMLLHQWHPNYRKRETRNLNVELQLTGIVEQNHLHLLDNLKQNKNKVNIERWGNCISKIEYEFLKSVPISVYDNEKNKINYFLFNELSQSKGKVLAIAIKANPVVQTIKYRVKRLFGKKTLEYYDLKTINDLFLQHIVSYHHHKPYLFEIASDLESIIFKIQT